MGFLSKVRDDDASLLWFDEHCMEGGSSSCSKAILPAASLLGRSYMDWWWGEKAPCGTGVGLVVSFLLLRLASCHEDDIFGMQDSHLCSAEQLTQHFPHALKKTCMAYDVSCYPCELTN